MCDSAEGAVDIAGQWAVLADLRVELRGNPQAFVMLCPDPQKQQASFLLKVTLSGAATSYTERVNICEITLPKVTAGLGSCPEDPSQGIETRIEAASAFAAYLPSVAVPNVVATLSGAEAGATYAAERFDLVLGADLSDPATDALPLWDTQQPGCDTIDATPETCVTGIDQVNDEDQDGHRGVTLLAEALNNEGSKVIEGEGYAVLRIAPRLMGTVHNAGCITGGLIATLQYSIVDSNITLSGLPLATGSVVQQLPPFEVLTDSSFRMLRADAAGANDFDDDHDGTVSCAEIQNHRSVFSR
jgi:hypothetical protein